MVQQVAQICSPICTIYVQHYTEYVQRWPTITGDNPHIYKVILPNVVTTGYIVQEHRSFYATYVSDPLVCSRHNYEGPRILTIFISSQSDF